jgi:hypothetical protein
MAASTLQFGYTATSGVKSLDIYYAQFNRNFHCTTSNFWLITINQLTKSARSNTLSTPLQIPKINWPICSVVRDRNFEEVSKPSYQGLWPACLPTKTPNSKIYLPICLAVHEQTSCMDVSKHSYLWCMTEHFWRPACLNRSRGLILHSECLTNLCTCLATYVSPIFHVQWYNFYVKYLIVS